MFNARCVASSASGTRTARITAAIALQVLSSTKDPERRLAIANDLVRLLERSDSAVVAPTSQLMRIDGAAGLGTRTYERARPSTPLSEAALLTNAHDEPNLGSELRAELDTSDEVDLLCAFVKWHGIRLLEPQLSRLRERGAAFRVITTTYMGATERAALDRLVREFGAEVKIQYDAQRTRLHSLAQAPRLCSRSSAPPSPRTGTTPRSKRTTPTGTVIAWTTRSTRPLVAHNMIASPSPSPASRYVRSPTSRRCSRPSRSSGQCTTDTGIWSSPQPGPARQ